MLHVSNVEVFYFIAIRREIEVVFNLASEETASWVATST